MNAKRLGEIVLLALITAMMIVGGVAAAATDDSLAKVKAAGVLRIGVDDAFPPMEYRDEKGKLIGFDVDLADEIGRRIGVAIEWVPTAWDGVILALQSGKFDIILSSMTITEERAKMIDFSPPYIQGAQIVVVREKDDSIKSLPDLAGKVVGSQLGSTGEVAARKISGIKELKLYGQFTEALTDLAIGRVQAVVLDEFVGRYYVTRRPGVYRVLGERLSEEELGIAFRKGDQSLRDAVCAALEAIKADGTYAAISKKWFGVDVSKR
ncbi:MAG: basic amino acid ABC transporter substrate-binding protein [Firmicutes bacterium]|jgi:polar amino acid transport system substrate-binding protein|nr:basic amino acid ABC transporter substrate-binding protein [Bacillota bacterium]MDH7494521.1 basic amino acid ABC transporter substrate-binding protein [Bacillota bacterium]